MATDVSFAEFVADQSRAAGGITVRKMFGEFALYCDGKVVGLLCDNQCFLKPTPAGRAVLGAVAEGAPYPGAKPHLNITDLLDDHRLVATAVRATADVLPAPKAKATKKAKPGAKQSTKTAKKPPKK